MNLTCMLRNCIFKKYNNKKVPIIWLIAIVVTMILLSIMTFNGWISLLPMLAVVLYSIALWVGNLKAVRITEIFSCLLFIIYNIKVFAITGLIATVIEMCAAIVAMYRFDVKKIEEESKWVKEKKENGEIDNDVEKNSLNLIFFVNNN